jgi:hypothetical protein
MIVRSRLDRVLLLGGGLGAGMLVVWNGTISAGLLGFILVLVVPGYLAIAALAERRPNRLVTVTLTLGLGLASAVLLTAGLAASPVGMTPATYGAALLIVLLVLAGLGITSGRRPWRVRLAVRLRDVLGLAIAASLVVVAFGLAIASSSDQARVHVLRLYVEPATDPGAPVAVAADNLGMGELDCTPTLRGGAGAPAGSVSGWPSFRLGDGERWRGELPSSPGATTPAEVILECVDLSGVRLTRTLRVWSDDV